MDELFKYEQEIAEEDKPPSSTPRPANIWRVAVIANVKGESVLPIDGPADAGAEFDRRETIQSIQDAIESDGHITAFIPADQNLPFALREFKPDICFNIAEGLGGDAREAQVPALLELLRIPYTASRVLANALGLDKTMTKRIWQQAGLPTAGFQEFAHPFDAIQEDLRYPLFVKPAREGTGMGMDARSIVNNEDELRRQVAWVINEYHQPALVEEFLPGREFTVGVLGREGAELCTQRPDLYSADGFCRLPVLEVESSRSVTPGVYGHSAKTLHTGDNGVPDFLCPAPIDSATARKMQDLAIRAHLAVGSVDVSRVDMRMDADGNPRLIEINTLPGLTPNFSDLCVIANARGLGYTGLILEILYLAATRFGLIPTRAPMRVKSVHYPRVDNIPPLMTHVLLK